MRAARAMQGRRTTLVLLGVLLACTPTPEHPPLDSLTGDPIEIAAMEAKIGEIMNMAAVPGLSMVILNDSQVVYANAFGLRDSKNESVGGSEAREFRP